MDNSALEQTRMLLSRAFNDPKFLNIDYLKWLYQDFPGHKVYELQHVSEDKKIAHMGGHRIPFHSKESEINFMHCMNVSVLPEARSKGVFKYIVQPRKFALENNAEASIGVVNRTKLWVHWSKCRVIPLPIKLIPALPFKGKNVRITQVNSLWLDSSSFKNLLEKIDFLPTVAFSRKWSRDLLNWRLRAPNREFYVIETADAIAITTNYAYKNISFPVLMKIFSKKSSSLKIKTNYEIINAGASITKIPAVLYVGLNARAEFWGIPLPRKFLPSAMNFVIKSADSHIFSEHEFILDSYELLDFDAL